MKHESLLQELKMLLEPCEGCDDPALHAQEIGRLYIHLHEFHSANEWLQKSLALKPDDPWTHLWLGNLAHQRQQLPLALEHYLRATALMPDSPVPFWLLGSVYDDMGHPAKAGECYKKAHAIDPEDYDAKYRLESWYERNVVR